MGEPQVVTRAHGNQALRDAVAAANSAQPAPVLIGDWLPRHHVLLVGRHGDDMVFYELTYATLKQVSEQDFINGDMSAFKYQNLEAVITPSR